MSTTSTENQEIDLRDLLKFLWAMKKWIGLSAFAFAMGAGAYAYLIASRTYTSSALLLPVQTNSIDQLDATAMLIGKKIGGNGDVELYQSLLTSRTVIGKLLRSDIRDSGSPNSARGKPLFEQTRLDTNSAIKVEQKIQSLSKSITVGSKEAGYGGILEVQVDAESPWLAQQIATNVLNIGQEEIRIVRAARSSAILSRLSVVVSLAKSEWDSAAGALAWYKERNRSITLPGQMLTLSRLEIERQSKEQKYLLARKEYEMMVMEREKAAPPMMILDPANLPAIQSKPKKKLIVIVGFLAGLMGSIVIILGYKSITMPGSARTEGEG